MSTNGHPKDLEITKSRKIDLSVFKPGSFLTYDERCAIIHRFNNMDYETRWLMLRLMQDQRSFGVEIGKRDY